MHSAQTRYPAVAWRQRRPADASGVGKANAALLPAMLKVGLFSCRYCVHSAERGKVSFQPLRKC